MRVAVIGSRDCFSEDYKIIQKYIPLNATEIVSGGAKGIDALAKKYAQDNGLIYSEFLPDFSKGKAAPLLRNEQIVDYSDFVLAFWNLKSSGTANVIELCIKKNKQFKLYLLPKERMEL